MNLQAILALIDQHLRHEQWETARNLCQRTLKSKPEWAIGYYRLGQAWVGLGETDAAIHAYTHCLQLQPDQIQLYASMGLLCQQTQQVAKAIAYYQKALTFNPQWVEVLFNLGMLYHQMGDWHNAIAQYKQVLLYEENHLKARFNLAILDEEIGNIDQAEQAYRTILTLKPEHINALTRLGKLNAKQKNYDAALAQFHCALELQPSSVELINNIGQIYLAKDQIENALQAHRSALTIDPLFSPSRLILGRLWRKHHQHQQAKFHLQLVIEQSPDHLDALNDLGLTHFALNEWVEAFNYFRQIAQAQSDFVTLFSQRLQSCSPDDWHGLSQLECRKFLQLIQDSNVPQALQSLLRCYQYLGQALLKYGAPHQAEQYFHQALKLNSRQADLYVGLAECLYQQERSEAAIAALSIGLTLYPQHPALSAQLTSIKTSHNQGPEDSARVEHRDRQRFYWTTQSWVETIASETESKPKFTAITRGQSQRSPSQATLSALTLEQCGGVTCHHCMDQLIQAFDPKALGHNVFQCSMTSAAELPPAPTFVVEIPHGQAWIAPQKNEWLICKEIAIMTSEQSILGDVSRFYPWYLPGCANHQFDQHPMLHSNKMGSPVSLDGRVAVLSSLSGHVYYHWMIDVLPRIGLLLASDYDISSIDTFIVNSLSKSYQRETLQALGIPLEKIIESDRIPYFSAQQLIVPSFPGELDWVPRSTIAFLRQSFLKRPALSPYKRIYISRSGAKYRQVVNESEIIELLQSFGFTSLTMEQFSVIQQAEIFAGAETIIAPHGAALTNLVFCSSGTKVIELFAPDYLRTDYWMISHQLKLEHYFIKGNGFKGDFLLKLMHQSALTEDMYINPDSLYCVMNHLGFERHHTFS